MAAAITLLLPAGASAQSTPPQVAVYPSPGTKYNLPGSQIAFRGLPASQIGTVKVVGSVSGAHGGQIEADSDGDGGSFVSTTPFDAGETVTVTTSLNVLGGQSGSFSFQIAHPSRPIEPMPLLVVPAGSTGLQHFRSRADLLPASVTVSTDHAPASEGDIFVAPQYGPAQNGPMILDPSGHLLWFDAFPVSRKLIITDFRVQDLAGSPVLTWFEGYTNDGTGEGEGVIFNSSYQQIATVHAANGLEMDLHEFLITPQGDAYIIAASPLSVPMSPHKALINSVIQEIDIKTGLVLFQWDALDHVPLSYSQFTTKSPGYVFDPYHANSVGVASDGNLIVSLRDTSAVYEVDRDTGQIIWELGGKHPSFKMGPGTTTAFQHDATVQANGNLTMFDDGAGPPTVHPYSRGLAVALNTTRMTATLVKQYAHSPQLSADFEGSVQQLADGNVFLGWGQQPYFSEENAAGKQIFDAHFSEPSGSYRAYRFPWSGQPLTTPALAFAPNANGTPELYASWNGATDVSRWQVLAGSSKSTLVPIGTVLRNGFETAIGPGSEAPYLEVKPLGASGRALAASRVVSAPAHIAIYGGSAFVPPASGFGALPVGCFTGHPCSVTTTITSGPTVLAHSGRERLRADGAGLVYFRLSPAARRSLARASGHRLPVQATVVDTSGARAGATLNLIPFSTRGAGPHRSVSSSPALALMGATDFVNSRGTGGILARCLASVSPCRVSGTVSVGKTVIARVGPETLGAGDLGYALFSLTAAGNSMLAHTSGGQLGVGVKLSSAGQQASGEIALVRFS